MKLALLFMALLVSGCEALPAPVELPPSRVDVECVGIADAEPNVCQRMLEAVQARFPVEVAVAARILIVDTCPPGAVCDRAFPYDAVVVLVPPDDSGGDLLVLQVFGREGQEVMVVPWAGPVPEHVRQVLAG